MTELTDRISTALKEAPDPKAALQQALQLVLAHFASETGTIHALDRETQSLHLIAETGLPPAMLDIVRLIPVGKGIAGQTAARGEPVTVCNLQTDTSGVAKPGARQTGVGGALCVPIRGADGMTGTLGIGTRRAYEYTAEETKLLEAVGKIIAPHVRLG